MFRLPRKLILFLILQLFLISLFLLTSTNPSFALNPQDKFYPSLNTLNEAKKTTRQQAQNDGQTRVTGQDANNYDISSKIYSLSNMIMCTDPDPAVCKNQNTAMGNVIHLISALYINPPASGLAYTRDLLVNAGFIKPTYAQGVGFAGLTPFLGLWKSSLNVSYLVLIIVMVAIGLMLVFRMKIDPKTVISLQAALPKIVATLIAITLSYPIVGFLIDVMYLSMAIIISLILNGVGGSMWGKDIAAWQTEFMTADIGDLAGSVFSGAGIPLVESVFNNLTGFAGLSLTTILASVIALAFQSFAWAITAAPALILVLIFTLGALFTFIRLLLLLLNSYIQLLISTILGPILLLQEAIPGKSAFTEWILNIMANLVVFPATVAIFLFASAILYIGQNTNSFWAPPFIGIGFNTGTSNMFSSFLSMGIIFLSPNLVAQIKKAFHPKPIIPFTAGTVFSPLTGGIQTAMGAGSQFYYMGSTIEMLKKMAGGGGSSPHSR